VSDWPAVQTAPMVTIHTASPECCGSVLLTNGFGASASRAWYGANSAVYEPFWVDQPITVAQLWCLNGGTVSGNLDMGLYTSDGKCLVSKGLTAQAGTSQVQLLDITDTVLGPGEFFLALWAASTSATFRQFDSFWMNAVLNGVCGQASLASGLPTTAMTPVNYTGTQLPIMGLTTRALF
jgi:hypothetical protein